MIGCIIIASARRADLLRKRIVPSVLREGFDRTIVVGEFEPGPDYEYVHVPPLTNTTNDALVKRDVGTLVAHDCDVLVYLSDDHALLPEFGNELRMGIAVGSARWDVIIPLRLVDHPERGRIRIPNGETDGYCAGHAGVFRRRVVLARPWSTYPRTPLWDLEGSRELMAAGVRFVCTQSLMILDVEPGATPWQ